MEGQESAELENPFQTFCVSRSTNSQNSNKLIPRLPGEFGLFFKNSWTRLERIKELQNKKSSGSEMSDLVADIGQQSSICRLVALIRLQSMG
jgi:hypothetical protein